MTTDSTSEAKEKLFDVLVSSNKSHLYVLENRINLTVNTKITNKNQ